ADDSVWEDHTPEERAAIDASVEALGVVTLVPHDFGGYFDCFVCNQTDLNDGTTPPTGHPPRPTPGPAANPPERNQRPPRPASAPRCGASAWVPSAPTPSGGTSTASAATRPAPTAVTPPPTDHPPGPTPGPATTPTKGNHDHLRQAPDRPPRRPRSRRRRMADRWGMLRPRNRRRPVPHNRRRRRTSRQCRPPHAGARLRVRRRGDRRSRLSRVPPVRYP